MKRILIAILTALTLLAGWTPAAHAADRTPLLMEGKKTLYQRVITHPGASLYAGQGEGSTVIHVRFPLSPFLSSEEHTR